MAAIEELYKAYGVLADAKEKAGEVIEMMHFYISVFTNLRL